MNGPVRDLLRAISLADAVDILLLAAFLYVLIRWLRSSGAGSAPRRVVALSVPLLAVYLLADAFQLFLVESLVRTLLIVLLLAIVVVFQTDLRRLLDRVAAWGFRRRPTGGAATSSTVESLAESAADLADTRTGALIAVRGAEPWDEHVHGGIELDGLVTRALLCSIFAPDTPGHDGAVLVEGARATRFGVHLPLSTRTIGDGEAGTRHAAALGLSEECDALVIAVSEERGTISVAQDGEIEVVSGSELGARLDRFWREHYARKPEKRHRWWGRKSLENGALALLLSAGAWMLFVYGADTVQRTFEVPIAFRNVPPEWMLEGDTLHTRVVLSGTEQAFRRVDPQDLLVSLDLSEPRSGYNELTVGVDDLDLPAGVTLEDADPREIGIVALRQIPIAMPVRVRTLGSIPPSIRLVLDPDTVTVLVPEGTPRPPGPLLTEPVEVRDLLEESSVITRLALPRGIRLGQGESVDVRIDLERSADRADPRTNRSGSRTGP